MKKLCGLTEEGKKRKGRSQCSDERVTGCGVQTKGVAKKYCCDKEKN